MDPFYIICAILVLLLLLLMPDYGSHHKKEALLKHIKVPKPMNTTEKIIGFIDSAFYELLHYDKKDSASKLFKELIYSVVIGVAIILAGSLLKMTLIGMVVGVSMLGLPLLIRWLNKREHKVLYQESFYRLVNYVILYLSGGLNILKAFEETERMIAPTDVIRENFLYVLKERKISGISGDNIINSLESLNRDYNLEEINQFINSLNLANKKGISIVEILKSQSSFIRKKQSLKVHERIASADTKLTLLKTLFGIGTAMAIFILPPIISAIISFGGTM